MCQGGWFFFPWMIKMLGYLFQTQKKYYLYKIMFFRVNTVAIIGRVKKGNSAEIEQVLAMIWWALNQAVVVEVKSICLHRNCSQTPPSEIFCGAYGIKSISVVKNEWKIFYQGRYCLRKEAKKRERGKNSYRPTSLLVPSSSSWQCLKSLPNEGCG